MITKLYEVTFTPPINHRPKYGSQPPSPVQLHTSPVLAPSAATTQDPYPLNRDSVCVHTHPLSDHLHSSLITTSATLADEEVDFLPQLPSPLRRHSTGFLRRQFNPVGRPFNDR